MLIKEKELRHWIDNFYGYGSWDARFWFVAHEEGGGEVPEEVAEKLNYFYKAHVNPERTLCDIRALYRHVSIAWDGPRASPFANRFEYRFGEKAIQNGVWKNLIAFEHAYKNERPSDTLAYQKNIFASPSERNEALIRFYPLPAAHSHAWYYNWLDMPQLSFLKSRTLYQQHLHADRMRTILSNMLTYKPEVVLMYGMSNINALKQSVQEFFERAKFQMVKATKREIPQHHRADLNGTTMLITTQIPALRHNRVETGFDWEAFGRRVKG